MAIKYEILTQYRKHQKRHERPYGCTFDKCNKSFGSKADWKRHENSQHDHLESWRCALQDPYKPELPCARQFNRRDIYVQHLREQHEVESEEVVQTSVNKNRLGGNCQPQFWCGFCRLILPTYSRGLAAWNERCNHIDSQHFKKGERFGDWLPPSSHLTKRDLEMESLSDDDDGDDGIELDSNHLDREVDYEDPAMLDVASSGDVRKRRSSANEDESPRKRQMSVLGGSSHKQPTLLKINESIPA